MFDGVYQSVICFFMPYLLFAPAVSVTVTGQDISDHERIGVYVACAAVMIVNTYVLMNTFRWDWLMLLFVSLSVLLVFFWTGVYSAFTGSSYFYKSAPQVFGQPSFWAVFFLTVIICLLPRFLVKTFQKAYYPYDVDIVREQARQGKFDYLESGDSSDKSPNSSTASSAIAKPSKHRRPTYDEEHRPIYPPSVAPTTATHNARSQNGSDGTDYTRHRNSMEPPLEMPPTHTSRMSMDRPRPSFDRMRASMDRVRPSYEASNDFTSAALLTRMESSQSFGPIRSRRRDISADFH